MDIDQSVDALPGIGPKLKELFAKVDVITIRDLVEKVPRRYQDYSNVVPIAQLRPGEVCIKVTISAVGVRYSRKGLHMTEAVASDETGSIKLIWFNQPYRKNQILPNVEYYVAGEFQYKKQGYSITNPSLEKAGDITVNTARIIPVYKLTKGLGLTQIRKAVQSGLDAIKIPETLPQWLIDQEGLMSRSEALRNMHFPETMSAFERARARLGFEEILTLTLASELNKRDALQNKGQKITFSKTAIQQFVSSLPFQLTDAQRKAAWDALQDMSRSEPMNRLLEGDVGSGKTVVAAIMILNAAQSDYQSAIMAPTEILARQHYETLTSLFEQSESDVRCVLLIGALSSAEKKHVQEVIQDGIAHCIIGTHALIQEAVKFSRLGLTIVDEQHRFGVAQRKALQAKARLMPHVLHMTATPIPRSLALTVFGELDISVIDEMPAGRAPVTTKLLIPERRAEAYKHVLEQVAAGYQAYIVCPQIEKDDSLDFRSVNYVFEYAQKVLKGVKIAKLHGKMSADEKKRAMEGFANKNVDVLVSTTVVEVGVNVPNATVMVIEGADRFGLATIHQLRGRVGHGTEQRYCYTITSSNDDPTRRLRVLEHETNGFKLADFDLEERGPGALYGNIQHGALDLRVARLSDVELIARARKSAVQFIELNESMLQYPELARNVADVRAITNIN